jgi:hypothetical protein
MVCLKFNFNCTSCILSGNLEEGERILALSSHSGPNVVVLWTASAHYTKVRLSRHGATLWPVCRNVVSTDQNTIHREADRWFLLSSSVFPSFSYQTSFGWLAFMPSQYKEKMTFSIWWGRVTWWSPSWGQNTQLSLFSYCQLVVLNIHCDTVISVHKVKFS